MTIGENLQKLRREKGLSQEELAVKISVTRQTISKWELDQSAPNFEYIVQLSEIFGVTCDYLIKGAQSTSESITNKAIASENFKSLNNNSIIGIFKSIIGIFISIISGIPIIVFVILSIMYPHEHLLDSYHFTGLTGWLFGNEAWYTFSFSCIGVLTGVAILIDDSNGIRSFKVKYEKDVILFYLIIAGLFLLLLNVIMIGFLFVRGITNVALTIIHVSTVIFLVEKIICKVKFHKKM